MIILPRVKLKMAYYEAEAVRKYLFRMLEFSVDLTARNDVIILAEHFQKFDSAVRSKLFRVGTCQASAYSIPLSVARILWYRWQHENNGEIIQLVLGKLDHQLQAIQRIPIFPKTLYENK